MHIALVGADLEENLALGVLSAVAERAGHAATVVPFDGPEQLDAAARCVMTLSPRPGLVGLSIQFQHRAHEFVALGRALRRAGFAGHLTCGGQLPSLAWRELLSVPGVFDSVALYEAESTFPELLDAVEQGTPITEVAGLALRDTRGRPTRTASRPLEPELDAIPFPHRYRAHSRHVGVPFVPILGSRGCWGKCSYCSITTTYREARANGGGKTFRLRSPENVAAEMALRWHAAGGPSIFCFHDDNFLLPRPTDTAKRVRAMRAELDRYGVGKVGIIGKARPDCVTPELAKELRELGVLRLYVGVENASEHGQDDLRRGTQGAHVRDALAACREAGIFVCYNLLIFEPDTTIEDLRKNVAFMREHAAHPVNFCRAEPYYGTPLQRDLEVRETLGGSWLGYDYKLSDARAELAFRICAAAFRERNFAPAGVANRTMSLGYTATLLGYFHDHDPARRANLEERATALTRAVSTETAGFLDEAIDLAEALSPRDEDAAMRATVLLGLRIAKADAARHRALDELDAEMEAYAAAAFAKEPPRRVMALPAALRAWAQRAVVGGSLAMFTGSLATACSVNDPVPYDSGFTPDAGRDTGPIVSDPLPPDMGARDLGIVVVDPAPQDAGLVDMGRDTGPIVADPPPPDAGMTLDAGPRDAGIDGGIGLVSPDLQRQRLPLADHWRDSSPRRAVRDEALPLWDPPAVALRGATREDGAIDVELVGLDVPMSTRWESDGEIDGEGRRVRWTPSASTDALRVAVRTRGGVAVVSLRARDV